ncbi:MAG TPA: aminotransferase class I/II-fold pyridoxal phosphate-dependent enzyme [Nitrososphaerales archaeon]|nr:aminotransferase class I/II-fold pyridoxal phosphate-dependent enzyme [Nitrososphaerales archaeon]
MPEPQEKSRSQPHKESTRKIVRPHASPIYQTSVYDYPDLETLDDYYEGRLPESFLYSRNGLPNSKELGEVISSFEKTDAGMVCASGMGAITVALLSSLKAGDRIAASNDLYGGTTSLLKDELPRFQIQTSFADSTSVEKMENAIKSGVRMVIVETISNPTMKVCDIEEIAKIAQRNGAILLVDNTFATPFIFKPVIAGADVIMHSGTKYLGGHDDLTIGLLCGKQDWITRAFQFCTRAGALAGPFDCWLATRSSFTWELRVKQCSQNALQLARYLESRSDKISKVYYPGLDSHPQHKLAQRLFSGGMYGGMLSFDLKNGFPAASHFAKSLEKVTLTPSLGGAHTTISHPGKTSHRSLTCEEKMKLGITDAMIRVSTGIEDYRSIEDEFRKALEAV